jgi:hypothetical protein
MTVWPVSCTCRGNDGSTTVQGLAEQGIAAACLQRTLVPRLASSSGSPRAVGLTIQNVTALGEPSRVGGMPHPCPSGYR